MPRIVYDIDPALKILIDGFDNDILSSSFSLLASTRTKDKNKLRQICLDRIALYQAQIKFVEDFLASNPVKTDDEKQFVDRFFSVTKRNMTKWQYLADN